MLIPGRYYPSVIHGCPPRKRSSNVRFPYLWNLERGGIARLGINHHILAKTFSDDLPCHTMSFSWASSSLSWPSVHVDGLTKRGSTGRNDQAWDHEGLSKPWVLSFKLVPNLDMLRSFAPQYITVDFLYHQYGDHTPQMISDDYGWFCLVAMVVAMFVAVKIWNPQAPNPTVFVGFFRLLEGQTQDQLPLSATKPAKGSTGKARLWRREQKHLATPEFHCLWFTTI